MLASQVNSAEAEDEKKPLSVTQALDVAKGALEGCKLRVLGEVSEVNVKSGYANTYFTLKDENGTLPCQMWRDRYAKCGVKLEVGMVVELVGRFSLYPKKGRMHFQVFAVSLAGEGVLRQQVAQLAAKLEAEGLMDPRRKVPVPPYPMKIGVVTSPRGDAIHDVLRTTRRRFPLAHVYVAGVPVEGAAAPPHMIEGMRACYRARVEVILLVRGGGSYEDLMPFNDENLARAIVKCPIPVVTGIGHEPDTTIADLVGDLRASTPTGAAEAVTVPTLQLLEYVRNQGEAMARRQEQLLQNAALRLERYASRPVFKDPRSMFANDLISLDMYHDRLGRALPASIQRDRERLSAYAARLAVRPAILQNAATRLAASESRFRASATLLERDALRLSAQRDRLREVSTKLLVEPSHQVALRAGRLHDLSPLAILSRGYAVARDAGGAIVKHVASVNPGDTLEVSVADGVISATVDSLKNVERG